ncbi:hypothetical protein [Pseudochryseolinea flava]|uniref:DprA winged helix domain-containing protein n=1 Tax=Pseudochryseolinea flava TaxID=2059302 RepID=A0A364XXB0_9BACT|nr:hypothetical protein [Pseudochryseolinea flava]RAV98170.1 hypothetical protein DQQ10_25220 [Pseudochryseolinea flava]
MMKTIELSEKSSWVLNVITDLGPCSAEQVMAKCVEIEQAELMYLLHDLSVHGLLVRPEIDEKILYEVKGVSTREHALAS